MHQLIQSVAVLLLLWSALQSANLRGQEHELTSGKGATPGLPALPAPLDVPKPGPATDAPYAPQPILPGGVVVPLYLPNSPLLKQDHIREPEQYNMSKAVPGRINSIVNIHNPSI